MDWHALLVPGVSFLEKVARTVSVYVFLLAGLRLAGKRELGQLNAFDFIVLLLLSNTLQNAIIGEDNSLLGGMVGAATLFGFNYLVVRFLYRHPWLDHVVEGEPDDLIRRGRVLQHNLRRNLITPEELAAAARRQGIFHLREVETCRLEVGGTLTFIPREPTLAERRHDEIVSRLDAIEARLEALASGRDATPSDETPADEAHAHARAAQSQVPSERR